MPGSSPNSKPESDASRRFSPFLGRSRFRRMFRLAREVGSAMLAALRSIGALSSSRPSGAPSIGTDRRASTRLLPAGGACSFSATAFGVDTAWTRDSKPTFRSGDMAGEAGLPRPAAAESDSSSRVVAPRPAEFDLPRPAREAAMTQSGCPAHAKAFGLVRERPHVTRLQWQFSKTRQWVAEFSDSMHPELPDHESTRSDRATGPSRPSPVPPHSVIGRLEAGGSRFAPGGLGPWRRALGRPAGR